MSLRWTLLVMPAALVQVFGCASGSTPQTGEAPDAGLNAQRPTASISKAAQSTVNAARTKFVRRMNPDLDAEGAAMRRSLTTTFPVVAIGPVTGFDRDDAGLHPIIKDKPGSRSTQKEAVVTLPVRADGATTVTDKETGITVSFVLEGAESRPAELADGVAVYEHAGPSNSTIIQRPDFEGTEDYFVFDSKARAEHLDYAVQLGHVAGLRLVSNTLEFLGEDGTPRLRVKPPSVTDAAGETHDAKLSVQDCRYDTDSSGPWGRPVVAPGQDHCAVRVSWQDVNYPLIVDPVWQTVGSLATARYDHNAGRLASGRVVVAGGYAASGGTALAELYDPSSRSWAATGSMVTAHFNATASSTPDGRFLVVGGQSNNTTYTSTAEIFDGTSWSVKGNLSGLRARHAMVVLPDSSYVVTGGYNGSSYLSTAERSTDGTGGTWVGYGTMTTARSFHRSAVQSTGRVWVSGGFPNTSASTVEYYNGTAWTSVAALTTGRMEHLMFVDGADNVIVAGGRDILNNTLASTEMFMSSFWAIKGPLSVGRQQMAFLSSSGWYALGGTNGSALPTLEKWDMGTNSWIQLQDMFTSRFKESATALSDGSILVAAGLNGAYVSTAELYGPLPNGSNCGANGDCLSGFCVDGVCCESACTGICRVCNQAGSPGYCMPSQIGTDPDNDCTDFGPSGCSYNGYCDGLSGCAKYPTGTTCQPTSCNFATRYTFTCDAGGNCVQNPFYCGPYVCNGTSCLSSCLDDSQCVGGNYCSAGHCKPQNANGVVCTGADQCSSGFCVDGFCCNSACTGLCSTCAHSKSLNNPDGLCASVAPSTDPDNECPDDGATGCQRNGYCDGAFGCMLYGLGVSCGSPTCAMGQFTTYQCDGNGSCNPKSPPTDCTPYACGNGICRTSCNTINDCAPNYTCTSNQCVKKSNGQTCGSAVECGSGYCVDGVCCDSPCSGTCVACSLALKLVGADGVCGPVKQGTDPKSQCPDQGAPTCSLDGWCDGNGGCERYPTGTQCHSPLCSGNTWIEYKCQQSNGQCVVDSTQCGTYVCSQSQGCLTSCQSGTDCISGYYCDTVQHICLSQGGSGQACTLPSQCANGFCVDGFCCDTACSGLCMGCAKVLTGGVDGQCSPIAFNSDPQNECATAQQNTCGTSGNCGVNGSCMLYAPGTTCGAAACVNGNANTYTCDGNGTCKTNTTTCGLYACANGACPSNCTVNSQCAPNAYCEVNSQTCRPTQNLGVSCNAAVQCASGFCVDGVCCQNDCGSGNTSDCQSCNASQPGYCKPLTAGVVCRAIVDICDTQEVCDGNSGICPTDSFKPAGTACRSALNECDNVETCSGASAACPVDTVKSAGATCTDDGKICTKDMCDGTVGNPSCIHPPGNGGAVCNPAVNECDTAEVCSGSTADCPTNVVKPSGTACTDDSNPCTTDTCNGVAGNPLCSHAAGNNGVVCRAAAGLCDAPETCNGVTTTCPADLKQPSSTPCRPANGDCDVADNCDGSSDNCPADVFRTNSYQCRAPTCSSGVATLAANCTGSSANCPTLQTQSCTPSTCNGTICGGCTIDSNCAASEFCSGGVCTPKKANGQICSALNECNSGFCADGVCCNNACNAGTCDSCNNSGSVGTCSAVPPNTVCRVAAGECDVAETCGGSTTCPADGKRAVNTTCTDDGNVCTLDICDGTNTGCTHVAGNAGQQCRAANGTACDVADFCDGTTTGCTDKKAPATTECRPSTGECDPAENCTGTTDTCPTDVKKPSGTACTDDTNPCTTDTCNGSAGLCQHPAGNAGATCKLANGACDADDKCTGTSSSCPDSKQPSSHVCRPAGGECDDEETCDGLSDTCPADSKKSAGTGCTDDGNPCSIDICNGTSNTCQHPAGFAGVVCKAAQGACDLADTCSGLSTVCGDVKQPPGTACRAAAGACDVAETCDGVSNSCPTDAFKDASVECRAPSCTASVATLAANCTGSSAACPAAQTQDCSPSSCNGTICGGCSVDTECAGTQYCSGGVCTTKKGIGAGCGGTNQCQSGFCADGVCCNTACAAGTCDSCVTSGKVGTCSPVANTVVCRPAVSECDVEETCNGQMTCPADATLDGQSCSTDNNVCTTDVCQGATCSHPAAPASTVCRQAAGECDVQETCGGATACPADVFKADNTGCTSDSNPCTLDVCKTGICSHPAGNSGGSCRPSTGECDAAEVCDGTNPTCPADKAMTDGTPCTSDGNVCTLDACTSGVCAHPAGHQGISCRAPVTECDVEEFCDGSSQNCPTDAFKTNGTACTDDGKACSKDECQSGLCAHPAGNGGILCRGAASECDLPESCDGASINCPTDTFKVDSTACTDDGLFCTKDVCLSGDCSHPSDDGKTCSDFNVCTNNDKCSASQCVGTQIPGCTCVTAADCDDTNVCNGAEQCANGTCVPGTTLACDDGETCTTDGCDPANGCKHTNLADGSSCDDGKYCTTTDQCVAGKCQGKTQLDCSGAATGQCQQGACNEVSNSCVSEPVTDGVDCDDNDVCTILDKCAAGVCKGQKKVGCKACATPAECDDSDPCTTDLCDDIAKTCTWVQITNCTSDAGPDADAAVEGGIEAGLDAEPDVGADAKDSGKDAADAKPDQAVADAADAAQDQKAEGAVAQDATPDQAAGDGAAGGPGELFSRQAPGCACRTSEGGSDHAPLGVAAGALLLALALRRKARRSRSDEERTML